jgi:hypothetical protein
MSESGRRRHHRQVWAACWRGVFEVVVFTVGAGLVISCQRDSYTYEDKKLNQVAEMLSCR